jgi:hypothetical protein
VTKRARYDGPHEEVVVIDSEADLYADGGPPRWVVQKGHLLPEDAPARIRDEFLHKDNEFWSEVNQADQSSAKKADDANDKKGDS